jgi:hypothetical protein
MLRFKRSNDLAVAFPELEEMRARAQTRETLTFLTMFAIGVLLLGVVASLAGCIIWLVSTGAGWLLRLLRDHGLSIADAFRSAASLLF